MAMFAAPAYAQNTSTPAAEAESSESSIIVTGTRIASPNLEAANPVAVVTGAELFETGGVSVGDLLNDLPQLRSTYSQQNSTRNLGNRGLNLLDLRGLGTERTLVLVNGRRHVGADVLRNALSPDINTIPAGLIERIDVVTGGASAVYGSDAIAGVVNFILKDDFEGLQARAQTGISSHADASNTYVGLLGGTNFADGRGNITVDVAYAFTDRFFASNRPGLRQNDGFVVVDTDPAGATNGSDGVFDRQFLRDIRSTTISIGGQIGIRYPNVANAPCGVDSVGSSFTCAFLFQPDGSLIPQTGTRVGLGPNGNFLGGNGYSGREGELIALSPQVKRASVNVLGHFEISPALVPFFEAKYVRSDAFGSQSGPFFSQGQTLSDSLSIAGVNDRSYASTTTAPAGAVNREGIRLDNPYLSSQARALIAAQATAAINAGVNPNTGAAFTTTAASLANKAALLAQVADGSFRFSLRRNFVELGIRDELFKRETFRVVAGLRGKFNDDWTYEISANYGMHQENNVIQSNVSRQRFLLAMDTAKNSSGQIVCRSQIDARYAGTDRAGNPSQLAADVAACVPFNPFGDGNISQAAKDYLRAKTEATGKITQLDLLAYVAGDTSQWFSLPGGPVGFSVGGEYRRETAGYRLDPYTQAGYAFYNAIPSLLGPSLEVKEIYGELRAPVLSGVPFFEELTLKGSGRLANYKGATGTVGAYGGEAIWKPVKDITFRGTYSRSVRSPTIPDLYSAQGQNFAAAPNDPCSARNLATGSATRSANCDAAGRPAGYDFVYTSSLEIVSGGNPNLQAETSDSWTFGGILEPRWIPGLSISADYYDVTVNNVITSIGTAQTILNQCYDSPTLNNPFCGLFKRAGASGGPRGEQPFRVLEGSLLQSTANFAKLKVRGIDVEANYRHKFDFGTVTAKLQWNHQLKNESYTNPSDPTFVDVFVGELNDPEDQVNYDFSFKRGKLTFGYQLRWIAGMYLNTYEDYNATNGLPPQNTDYAPIVKYPSVFYHDFNAAYDVSKNLNLYVGIDNAFNRMPPYGLTGVGAGSGIYDVRGQYFYAGVRVKL
ncbi:MAG: TonB-dependent receptor [Sphingobium sp.]|nr:TonB-dependent receptor [Sphingobium sp.]